MNFQIVKELQNNLKHIESKRVSLMEKMNDDYCYNFCWNGEDLFRYSYKAKQYKSLLDAIYEIETLGLTPIDTAINETIKNEIELNEMWLKRSYNVRENSTGSLFREASIWKYQETMDYVQELKTIIALY